MRKQHHLTALRAFECVARLKSISAAAHELHVSRPAVSKQVTLLEQSMKVSLLTRTGNAIQLTAQGEELFEGLHRAFGIMAATVESVVRQKQKDERLRVLVCRDFASSWLAGQVGAFLVDNPGVALEITAEKNGNLRLQDDFDLRIFYGMPGQFAGSGLEETELCRWIDMPVCTAPFAQRFLADKGKSSEAPYLIDGNYDVWDEWCIHTGFDGSFARKHTTVFNETTLCLSVAKSGGGLTIGDSFLALPAIIAGELTVPFPSGLISAQAYSLHMMPPLRASAASRQFAIWLKNAIDAYQATVLRVLEERGIQIFDRNG